MQAVFVDIGLQRTGFLHAADMVAQRADRSPGTESAQGMLSSGLDIMSLAHEGQELVVQVTKDPIGSKGTRLTTQLSLPSRHLVR